MCAMMSKENAEKAIKSGEAKDETKTIPAKKAA